MLTNEVLQLGAKYLQSMHGHVFDVLEVKKPISVSAALDLTKVISKLSPLVANMIEFNCVDYLNSQSVFNGIGSWRRQDPGFPDTVFDGVFPTPGFEIKAWFPLATEITARFKDSQNHFVDNQTYVAMIAWLPEYLIYGRPQILGVCIVSALSVAQARDNHYHRPPDYIVLEPENTVHRTANLQQTNTNGYKFQGTPEQLEEARMYVENWGVGGSCYSSSTEYQQMLRGLQSQYLYRLDTNFAKMDRIIHTEIEQFKTYINSLMFHGMTVGEWQKLLNNPSQEHALRFALMEHIGITDIPLKSVLV